MSSSKSPKRTLNGGYPYLLIDDPPLCFGDSPKPLIDYLRRLNDLPPSPQVRRLRQSTLRALRGWKNRHKAS